jgi:hypothetical protein
MSCLAALALLADVGAGIVVDGSVLKVATRAG